VEFLTYLVAKNAAEERIVPVKVIDWLEEPHRRRLSSSLIRTTHCVWNWFLMMDFQYFISIITVSVFYVGDSAVTRETHFEFRTGRFCESFFSICWDEDLSFRNDVGTGRKSHFFRRNDDRNGDQNEARTQPSLRRNGWIPQRNQSNRLPRNHFVTQGTGTKKTDSSTRLVSSSAMSVRKNKVSSL